MARKTFISYKFSEAKDLRDRIIAKLGSDATYYRGENGYSTDMSSRSADYIKDKLKDMLFDTSVTIVILSQNMRLSQWIEWELQYSLREQTRDGRTSHADGIVAVVQKQPLMFGYGAQGDGYAWLKDYYGNWDTNKLLAIIKDNRGNKKAWANGSLSDNYIDIVTEYSFLQDPSRYIEEAYNKSQNIDSYNITKMGGGWW
jgi:hypothetical protein